MIVLPLQELSMLTTLYTQPHRYYHNLDHINFCLGELERCDGVDHATRRIVTYAIWYHDAIYNPYSSENEYQSEELFYRYHRDARLFSFEEFDAIGTAIRATAFHTTHQSSLEFSSHLMLDIDLAGLGQKWDVFKEHGDMIRLEYQHIDDDTFMVNRIKFLETLLSRPRLYYSSFFHDIYEKNAEANLTSEIQRLQCGDF